MKHCPQCEFTFDDRQELCDFDGSELLVVPESAFPIKTRLDVTSQSVLRRLIKSRSAVSVLALAGVVLSALLIGYYDSVSQARLEVANLENRNEATNASTEDIDLAKLEQSGRPRTISTQRKIGADELPASMTKRLRAGLRTRDGKPEQATSRVVTTKRGAVKSHLVSRKIKSRNSNKLAQARSHARSDSRGRHSVAINEKPRQMKKFAIRNSQSEIPFSAHHKKDSKVVAIFKKTGSILKRPFELFADR